MSNNNVHPIFESLLNSFSEGPAIDTIPTSEGDKTIPEVMDHLMWCSYKANKGYGTSHELLVKNGIGNESMRERYERETAKS